MNGDIALGLIIGFVVGYLAGLIYAYSSPLPRGHQPRATDNSPTRPPRPGRPPGWRPVDRFPAPPPPPKDD